MPSEVIEKYCEKMGARLAAAIDGEFFIIVKPRPWWCPAWLYGRIVRDSVELVQSGAAIKGVDTSVEK